MDQTEKIEQYLDDNLSKEERGAFEREIEENSELREELQLQLRLRKALQARQQLELKEKVAAISQSQQSEEKKSYLLVKIAAVAVLVLASTYYLVHLRYTNDALSEYYDTDYPDRITTMGGPQKIDDAMRAYNAREYEKALQLFKEIQEKEPDDRLAIYQAVAYRKLGKNKEAIYFIQRQLEEDKYSESLHWELVLNYLANDQEELAEKELNSFLKQNNGYKQQEAEALKSDLESFWR